MIGIYKITNKINNHSYIGQSVNIEKRWIAHKNVWKNQSEHTYQYPLYRAIRKYGLENFDFSILEECNFSELDDREKYWIKFYDTVKNGYNQTIGGLGSFKKLNNLKLLSITNDIKNSKLSFKEISEKYNISYEMVTGINTGRYWKRDINYPIRINNHNYKMAGIKEVPNKKKNYCEKCGKEISKKAHLCIDCSLRLRAINIPPKEELSKLLLTESMLSIAKKFNVTDNAVRRWCKKYNLPYKFQDIKEYRINLKHIA